LLSDAVLIIDPMAVDQPAPSNNRSASRAVTAVFVAHGLLFASWTAHIPQVKGHLRLTDGTLGIALLGAPLGAVAAMILSARLLPRFGSRRVVQAALVGYCAAGPLVGLTGNLFALFAALFVWGAFQGALDVAMNTQAIAVERARRESVMPGLHGGWSIGSFMGAGIGALAVGERITLTTQLLVLGTVALLLAGVLTARMLPDATARTIASDGTFVSESKSRTTSRWSGGMLMLGAIAFASMLCEGATADWSSVYLSGSLHAKGAVAGLGYAAFCLSMVAVRLSGNRLLARYRPNLLLPVLATVATVGFSVGLLINRPIAALAGLFCLGLGLASIVPAVFSAAGRLPGLHPGTAVATASACGWTGFVCGPPLIGRLASWTSLPVALALIPILTAFIVVAASTSRGLKTQLHDAHPSGVETLR
jgi:MFS family permease